MMSNSLDILSRSKGMETSIICGAVPLPIKTLDILSRSKGIETVSQHYSISFRCIRSLDILSRSKGIETFGMIILHLESLALWIYFPARRELKHVAAFEIVILLCSLNILSRSKGMETSSKDTVTSSSSGLNILSRSKGMDTAYRIPPTAYREANSGNRAANSDKRL